MPTDAQLRLEGAYSVVEWMRVRNRETGSTYDADGLKCDLDHSALLQWLCQGQPALEERPPVRFSRPDHRAAIDGLFYPTTVVHSPAYYWRDFLIVDQEAWKIIETKDATAWVAAYRTKSEPEAWSGPWSVHAIDSAPGWMAQRLP